MISKAFERCPLVNKLCAMCGTSNYNITNQSYQKEPIQYCGAVTSGMNKIQSLEKCWLEMNGYEKRKHKKRHY